MIDSLLHALGLCPCAMGHLDLLDLVVFTPMIWLKGFNMKKAFGWLLVAILIVNWAIWVWDTDHHPKACSCEECAQ